MISQPTYDGCLPNFFLPRSEAAQRVDALCEFLNSPSVLEDDIACLQAEIAEHQKGIAEAEEDLERKNVALAAAYAKPEYDRRRPHDDTNVTIWETCCRACNPTCQIEYMFGSIDMYRIIWSEDQRIVGWTDDCYTLQSAWRAAFNSLDRRKVVNS